MARMITSAAPGPWFPKTICICICTGMHRCNSAIHIALAHTHGGHPETHPPCLGPRRCSQHGAGITMGEPAPSGMASTHAAPQGGFKQKGGCALPIAQRADGAPIPRIPVGGEPRAIQAPGHRSHSSSTDTAVLQSRGGCNWRCTRNLGRFNLLNLTRRLATFIKCVTYQVS